MPVHVSQRDRFPNWTQLFNVRIAFRSDWLGLLQGVGGPTHTILFPPLGLASDLVEATPHPRAILASSEI
jgi:hypothetical protein